MKFLRSPRQSAGRVAMFAGAFHPPTLAHVALAEAALQHVDEIVWVMPRAFPHKSYDGVSCQERLDLLLGATSHPVALAEENYFFAMAEELSRDLPGRAVHLLAGEDGAQRLFDWDYGLGPEAKAAFLRQGLERFPLLTARRGRQWRPPEDLAGQVAWLDLPPEANCLSSTLVRDLLRQGGPWRRHVPAAIADRVAEIYGAEIYGTGVLEDSGSH